MWLGSNTDIQEIKATQEELSDVLERERSRAAVMSRLASASKSMNAILSMESIARILCEEARIILDASVSMVTLLPKEGDNREVAIVSPSAHDGRFRSYLESPIGLKLGGLACGTGRPTRLAPDNMDMVVAWAALQESGQRLPEAGGWLAAPLLNHDGKNIGLIQLFRTGNRKFSADAESVLEQLAAIAAIGIENARLYERLREQDTRKDEFLATLAHELRNPLAPITTGLAILRNGRPEMTGKIVGMMERQMGHLVRLVDDVLDVSRVTSGKITLRKERVVLRHVIDTAMETSRPLMEQAGHMLTVDMPDHAIWLQVDHVRMVQVLTNLLNNAAKYTPPGGRIHLTARKEDEELVIQIVDNGIGIPQDMLPKVFELFTQVKGALDRAQGGLGLGLALVRRLVEMHGGTVEAASGGRGIGSTFSVRLPMEPAALVMQETDIINKDPTYQPRTRRILVVDDNIDAAETLAMILAIDGHEIATAYTGPAAVETARRFKPDVAFLDIGLPGMNGYEVARVLRGSCPTLIALTGWGAENDRQRAKEAGFDFHLTKPVSAEKVKELLARAGEYQQTT
jgi:signal transduction histidine kinase/ActR/RegA family two-component response regulator